MKTINRKNNQDPFWNIQRKTTRRLILFEPIKVKQVSNSHSVPRMIKPTPNPFYIKPAQVKVPVKKVVNKIKIIKDDTKKVPLNKMNWFQAKNKFNNLNPLGDADKDGLMNMFDCKPFNKKRRDEFSDVYEKQWKAQDVGRLTKAEKLLTKKIKRQKLIPRGMTTKDYDYYSKLTPEDLDGEETMGTVPLKTREGTIYVRKELAKIPTTKEALEIILPKNAPSRPPKRISSGNVMIPSLIGKTTKREKRKLESIRYIQREEEIRRVRKKLEEGKGISQQLVKTSPVSKTMIMAPSPYKEVIKKLPPNIISSPYEKVAKELTQSFEKELAVKIKAPVKKGEPFELIAPGQTWRFKTRTQAEKGRENYIKRMSRVQARVQKAMIRDVNDLQLLSPQPAPTIQGIKTVKGKMYKDPVHQKMVQDRYKQWGEIVPSYEVQDAIVKPSEIKVKKGRLSYSLVEGLIGLNVAKVSRETGVDPLRVSKILRSELAIDKLKVDLRENTVEEAKRIAEQKAEEVERYLKENVRISKIPPRTVKEAQEELKNLKELKRYAKIATGSAYLGIEKEMELERIREKEKPIESRLSELKELEKPKSKVIIPIKYSGVSESEKEYMRELKADPWETLSKKEFIEPESKPLPYELEMVGEKYESEDYEKIPEVSEISAEKLVEETPAELPTAEELVEQVEKETKKEKSSSAQELIEEVSDEK
jgi:hypothetical protein